MSGQANDGTVFGRINRNFQYGATQRLAGKLLTTDFIQRFRRLRLQRRITPFRRRGEQDNPVQQMLECPLIERSSA